MKNQFMRAANAFHNAFETRQRENGDAFLSLADGSPDWMRDAIHAAHGDRMPCDAIYTLSHDAVEFIADNCDDADDASDYAHDFADGAVSVYNADRALWLAENLAHGELVDDAISDGLASLEDGIYQAIGAGMVEQARRVYEAIREAIDENAPALFVAGMNMPGFMPDGEPAEFDEFDDARQFIIDELLNLEEEDGYAAECAKDGGAPGEFERLEAIATEYRHAAESVNHKTAPFTIIAGNYAFWVVENE